ncbi:Transposable element P transposase [Frankliniella fusca]|uniref:Transposable element P transposase n=1 Tax=Frankliniella fusca TaxID=407009 RepID=A0AAE1H7W8_9NEOP|nr:Transposable element P transposase [Frankliniella fusca]
MAKGQKGSRSGRARCTAPNCNTTAGNGISLFTYPKDEARLITWLKNIGKPDWTPYNGARLCKLHFSDSALAPNRIHLLRDAVPFEVRLPLPQPVCACVVEKKTHLRDHPCATRYSLTCKVHRHLHPRNIIDNDLKKSCHLHQELHQLENAFKPKQEVESKKKRIVFNSADIRRGLRLWMGCGSSGYRTLFNLLNKEQNRLPSIRCMQKATAHLKFAPGLLREVLIPLKAKFDGFTDPRDRDVNIVFDEFVMKQQVDYDPSTHKFIGYGTLPGQEKVHAVKTELFMLRSVHQRMKQIVAYQQNPKEIDADTKKDFIIELIRETHKVGANVISLVCDMGNRGVLTSLGFSTKKNSLKWSIPNPVTGAKLWCSPDPVHIFKSMKESLCANKFIHLPDRIVAEYGLPSATVEIAHIEWLAAYQKDDSLQLMPGLTFKDTISTHFSKMNIRSPYKIFNKRCAASLKYLVVRGIVPEEFETTAWFLLLMNRWFQLMCSRNLQFALGFKNMDVYNEAIEHLKLVILVSQHAVIPGGWKAVQSHIKFATSAMLEVQHYLLHVKMYKFLQTGGFSSDCCENVNSLVRMSTPNPTPLETKNKIKHITIAQFNMEIKSSSYNFDDCEDYIDLLLKPGEKPAEPSFDINDIDFSAIKWSDTVPITSQVYDDVLYRLSGYIIITLQKKKELKCEFCISALKQPTGLGHPNSLFLKLTDFVPGAQFPVIDDVFQMFKLIEYNLMKWVPQLRHVDRLDALIDLVVQPGTAHFNLPTCHSVKEKLVKTFTNMRYRQLARDMLSPAEKVTAEALASRTAGGQYLTQTTPLQGRTNQPASPASTSQTTPTPKSSKQRFSFNNFKQTYKYRVPLATLNQNITSPSPTAPTLPSTPSPSPKPFKPRTPSLTLQHRPPSVFLKRILNLP